MTQIIQKQNSINAEVKAIYAQEQSNQTLYTVEQFSDKEPAFTPSALRNLIFKAEPRMSINGMVSGNGLIECGAIVRIGRKILINEEKFFDWIESQQKSGGV